MLNILREKRTIGAGGSLAYAQGKKRAAIWRRPREARTGEGNITVNKRIPRALRRRRVPALAGLLVLLGVLVVSAASGAPGGGGWTASGLTPDSTFSAAKSDSGHLAQTDPSLLGSSDSSPVAVMIKYDYDATASYKGGVDGLAATSPAVTGVPLD